MGNPGGTVRAAGRVVAPVVRRPAVRASGGGGVRGRRAGG